jgi:hypothetical protein
MIKGPGIRVLAAGLFIAALAPVVRAEEPANNLVRRVVQNEIAQQERDNSHWMYRIRKEQPDKIEVKEVAETPQGSIARLIAYNDRALTADEQLKEDERIQKLVQNPDEQKKKRKEQHDDAEKAKKMLQMLPEAFIFQYDGMDGEFTKLKFTPNPNFDPPTREAQVFHAMAGEVEVDAKQLRLAKISGTLMEDVEFGWGILGHLYKGGHFYVEQKNVGENHWETVVLDVKMQGRALFFKTISEQQKQYMTEFHRIPDNLTMAQAAELLEKTPNVVASSGAPASSSKANRR